MRNNTGKLPYVLTDGDLHCEKTGATWSREPNLTFITTQLEYVKHFCFKWLDSDDGTFANESVWASAYIHTRNNEGPPVMRLVDESTYAFSLKIKFRPLDEGEQNPFVELEPSHDPKITVALTRDSFQELIELIRFSLDVSVSLVIYNTKDWPIWMWKNIYLRSLWKAILHPKPAQILIHEDCANNGNTRLPPEVFKHCQSLFLDETFTSASFELVTKTIKEIP